MQNNDWVRGIKGRNKTNTKKRKLSNMKKNWHKIFKKQIKRKNNIEKLIFKMKKSYRWRNQKLSMNKIWRKNNKELQKIKYVKNECEGKQK